MLGPLHLAPPTERVHSSRVLRTVSRGKSADFLPDTGIGRGQMRHLVRMQRAASPRAVPRRDTSLGMQAGVGPRVRCCNRELQSGAEATARRRTVSRSASRTPRYSGSGNPAPRAWERVVRSRSGGTTRVSRSGRGRDRSPDGPSAGGDAGPPYRLGCRSRHGPWPAGSGAGHARPLQGEASLGGRKRLACWLRRSTEERWQVQR